MGTLRILRRLTAASTVLALTVAAACGGASSPEGAEVPEFRGFFDSFVRGLHIDYTTFDSLEEMVEISDVVLVGEIESVRPGRTFGGPRGARGTIDTLLLWTRVTEVARGELHPSSRKIVEIEVFKPEFGSIEQLHESRPQDPMLFILQDTATQPQPHEVDDSAADHAEGKPIYTIPTTKAAFMEDGGGGVITPFSPATTQFDRSIKAKTLEELVEEIRRLP